MVKNIQEYIVDDYKKCAPQDDKCHNCKAYLVPYSDDRPVCLSLILQQLDDTLKDDMMKLLEKY